MHGSEGAAAIELAFVLGALHALEPGHGKTALFAYMLDGKKKAIHSVVMGVMSGVSHTASIMVFAFLAHMASHLLTDGHDSSLLLTSIFTWASGLLMTGIGIYLLWRALGRTATSYAHAADACGCGKKHTLLTTPHRHTGISLPKTLKPAKEALGLSALLGMSGGLMPCPSALATYMSGMAGGNTQEALFAILIYAFGIAVCITGLGFVFHLAGEKAAKMLHGGSYARVLAYVQAAAIFSVGIFYTARALLAFIGAA